MKSDLNIAHGPLKCSSICSREAQKHPSTRRSISPAERIAFRNSAVHCNLHQDLEDLCQEWYNEIFELSQDHIRDLS